MLIPLLLAETRIINRVYARHHFIPVNTVPIFLFAHKTADDYPLLFLQISVLDFVVGLVVPDSLILNVLDVSGELPWWG